MRGVYTATIGISSLSGQKTLMYLTTPSTMVVELLSAAITNKSNNSNEQLEAGFYRITSLGSPTKTDITAVAHESSSPSTAVTVAGNVTASEPTYASNPAHAEAWSNLIGYHYDPIPESRVTVPPSSSIGLRITETPATAFDAVITITYREIG